MTPMRNHAVAVAGACALFAAIAISPARAAPGQRCDPESPLYDPAVCYNDGGPHRDVACDPDSDDYDADDCTRTEP
jgi:hypothetical protein